MINVAGIEYNINLEFGNPKHIRITELAVEANELHERRLKYWNRGMKSEGLDESIYKITREIEQLMGV